MNSLLIARNIVKRAFKNKKEIIILLVLPIAAILLITFFTGSQSAQAVNAGLLNRDNGVYGQKLAGYIKGHENINLISLSDDEYKNAVKDGKASFVIAVPDTFTSDIENGIKTNIEFLSSGVSETSEKMKQDIDMYVSGLYTMESSAADIAKRTGNDKSVVLEDMLQDADSSVLTASISLAGNSDDENNKMRLVQSIGFAIMFIMVFIFITVGTMMEDKRKLTIARISTFQVKNWEIAAGNLLGSLFLGIIQLIPVIAVLSIIYGLRSIAEIAGMFLILLCFLIATIGLGIGISGIIKNNLNPAILIAIVIFPTSLLGGCLIPESMLPSILGKIGYIVPQKWVMSAVQKLMTGAGFESIALDLGIVLMFGLALATFGVKTLKPMND